MFALRYVAAAPSPAQELRREGLKELTAGLAKSVRKAATQLQQPAVRIGYFTPFGSDLGNAGGAFMVELELALQGAVNPDAVLELYGSYGLVEQPEGGGVRVIVVEAKLRRTKTGRDEKEFAPFEGVVRSNTDIARLAGATVAFKPDAEYKDPTRGRNTDIQDGLPQKPPGGGPALPPKVQAFVDGPLVRTSKDSPYAVEVRKKAVGAPGDARPVPAELRDGLAFVPIDRGEEYEVRVVNHAPHEIAVSLSIDGIDQFAFSEDRTPEVDDAGKPVIGTDGKPVRRPKFSHWVVGPATVGKPGEVLILGWHKTADPTRKDNVMSFLVTEYGKGAASRFPTRTQGKVGLMTVGIARSFKDGEPRPRSASETGFGPDREQKQEVVKRHIDAPHEFVTIRYTR